MNRTELIILAEQIDRDFLPFVRRPSRYIGGEINQIKKDLHNCALKVALCFPDTYEVGMSYTGLAIIYDILNKMDDVAAERVFAPWLDAEGILRKKNIPLFSLESRAVVNSFDVLGFSLTSELCYTNVLNMLDLAGIPVLALERGDTYPLVIAGGTCALNPEPLADFVDAFVIGDGEEVILEFLEAWRGEKGRGKKALLRKLAAVPGVYVPGL